MFIESLGLITIALILLFIMCVVMYVLSSHAFNKAKEARKEVNKLRILIEGSNPGYIYMGVGASDLGITKRLEELEKENKKLKGIVAELTDYVYANVPEIQEFISDEYEDYSSRCCDEKITPASYCKPYK